MDHGHGGGGGGNGGTGVGGVGNGGTSGGGGGGSSGPAPCVGLACQQMSCPGGGTTTLTGKVFAPNGTLPLYNVIVYVPNGVPTPLTAGVTCDRCDGHVSGDPLVQTLTGPDGSFTLPNVPVGKDIPLVVQIGKWRRQVKIASVPACQSTAVTSDLTRLPKNHSEGDIPKMAIATGSLDPFECLLLRMGLDSSEFTPPGPNAGRVDFYTNVDGPGTDLKPAAPKADKLYPDLKTLMQYDIVILPCEGTPTDKPAAARSLFVQYLNMGGRLFTTHYSYDWLHYDASPLDTVGKWNPDQDPDYGLSLTYSGTLDTTFPKGMAFSQWMSNVTMPPIMGAFDIDDPRNDIDSVTGKSAQRWIYHEGDNRVLHMTFNTPVDAPVDNMGNAPYCGRVVYSDFHVSTNDLNPSGGNFPKVCDTKTGLTTQEKALVFMLFDLSSCVQSDGVPPIT